MMIDTWTRREKILMISLILTVVIFGVLYFSTRASKQLPPASSSLTPYQSSGTKKEKAPSSMIVVDLKGEVNRPGIYRVPRDARLYQAIAKAGGLTSRAEEKRLNLAQKLQDGSAIYIPRKGEAVSSPGGVQGTGEGPININTATASELDKLDGIGPSRAEAIVRYREEHGPFQRVEDLQQIPGIGEKTLAKFREQITCY